jgi:hypothetical protein
MTLLNSVPLKKGRLGQGINSAGGKKKAQNLTDCVRWGWEIEISLWRRKASTQP